MILEACEAADEAVRRAAEEKRRELERILRNYYQPNWDMVQLKNEREVAAPIGLRTYE